MPFVNQAMDFKISERPIGMGNKLGNCAENHHNMAGTKRDRTGQRNSVFLIGFLISLLVVKIFNYSLDKSFSYNVLPIQKLIV